MRQPSIRMASMVRPLLSNRSTASEISYSPPVGGLDQVTGVEDGQRERVEAGHHQVRRRVLGLLQHLGDPPYLLVSQTP